ncbi:MAG: DUF975 family protein [Lachnospiraceae bacterium]|nr:DUF975 family protein [Lachnospiraceae bacterium]
MNERWTRAMLKGNAKKLFRKNYWVCVVAAFLLALLGNGNVGGFGNIGASFSQERDIRDIEDIGDIDYFYNYNFNGDYLDRDYLDGGYFEYETEQKLFLIVFAVVFFCVFAFIIVLSIFVFNVIEVGGKMFFIQNRSCTPPVGMIFDGFKKGRYSNIMKTMFFRSLSVFLWSLLLIIPGIIKSYEYLMVPYILAENPTMDRRDVLDLSKRMMKGQKWDAFILSLSFFGWMLLSAITCGLVGIFYVSPYYMATFTELYAFSKIKAYNEGYIR